MPLLKKTSAAILLLLLILPQGCIRSRFVLTTEPSEAAVYFQGEYRGKTPVSIPFIWYWYYNVRVEKEGFQTVKKVEYLPPPPWFVMPLDLIGEILPIPIPDNHYRHYKLQATTQSDQQP